MSEPIDVNAVIRRTMQIYVDQAPVLMPAAAVVFVINGIVSQLLVAASATLAPLALIVGVIATILFTGMVVELVADVQDGKRDTSARRLLGAVTPVFWQLVAVAIVAAVGVAIGLVLLVIPGLILMTIWFVAAPVVVLERPGVFAALRRSQELVAGNGWQVFGVIFLLVIMVVMVGSVIELGAESAGAAAGLVAWVVVGILAAPFSALAAAVLYFQLRGPQVSAAL